MDEIANEKREEPLIVTKRKILFIHTTHMVETCIYAHNLMQ